MAMEGLTMVIKVKYQETLRRFNVGITDGEIDLNMDRLREKIFTLFNLTPSTDIMLTYTDEDGDEVSLVDDDDLRDVVKQALNPLRISAKLNTGKSGIRYCQSGSSISLRSPCVQQPSQNVDSGGCKIVKTVPGQLCETIVKLSTDLASKASSSASGVTELVDYFSKVSMSCLSQCPDFQHAMPTTAQSDKSSAAATDTKNSVLSEVFRAALKVPSSDNHNEDLENENEHCANSSNGEKLGIAAGVFMKAPSLTAPGSNDVALESQTFSAGQSAIYSLRNSAIGRAKSKVVPDKVSKKEKAVKESVKKTEKCHSKDKSFPPVANTRLIGRIVKTNVVPTKDATNIRGPKIESYTANFRAPDHIKVDHLGGRTESSFPGNLGNSSSSIWAPNLGISKYPELFSSPSSTDDCSISRIPLENVSAFRSQPVSKAVTSNRCNSQNVDNFHVFHCGVCCDGCGVHPITGPRFNSKVKEDYDLCMICFAEMGNASDYIRIDRPVVYPHHVLYDSHTRSRDPVSSQDYGRLKVKSCLSEMDSCFIQDVNVAYGTVMTPLTPFTKIWRLKNNGIVAWPKKTIIFWTGGDVMSYERSVELEIPAAGLAIDQELDVAVDCIAPALPGEYESCWELASPSGHRFGELIWIHIKVVASVAVKPQESVRSFNLNLPPLSSCLNDPENINVIPEPIVEHSQNKPDSNSKSSVESMESVVNLKPKTEHETSFPINNSFLVGSGASSSFPSAPAPVSETVFNSSDKPPALASIPSVVIHPSRPLPDMNLPASADEEMGFKFTDLNEDASAMSEDDTELDDVSDFSEWDPILDELFDMGFYDTEKNMKLLEKNNGSVTRVVMELIAAETK